MAKIDDLIEQIVGPLQGYVRRCLEAIAPRIKAVEDRLDALPAPEAMRGEKGDQGPPGERGADGDPGDPGKPGDAGQQGEKGMDGRDGEPGRDAPHVDVLDGIELGKRYQRGTWAAWRGGLIRSFRQTDPLGGGGAEIEKAGWHVVVRGLDDVSIEIGEDQRTVAVRLAFTGDQVVTKTMSVPTMIYRGVWKDGDEYAQGDSATRDGSVWVLMTEKQAGKPGDADSGWQLAVKRGTHGRDGLKGEKGDRGAEGRAGQDLARMSQRGPLG